MFRSRASSLPRAATRGARFGQSYARVHLSSGAAKRWLARSCTAAARELSNIAEVIRSLTSAQTPLQNGPLQCTAVIRKPQSAIPPMSNIVLTGAGRGLGRAMVERFVASGHVVFACSQSQDRVAELRTRFKGPHRFAAVNITSDDQVADWA